MPDTIRYQTLMTSEQMAACLDRLARNLLDKHGGSSRLGLIGIQRRGVNLATSLSARMAAELGRPVPVGSLDITLYRDDWTGKSLKPAVGETRILFDVEGKVLILVDDVLFTGRTIRAALEALADFGRPSKIELLVLVDRGHRELPIHPDYVGLICETRREDQVDVLVEPLDGSDSVRLVRSGS